MSLAEKDFRYKTYYLCFQPEDCWEILDLLFNSCMLYGTKRQVTALKTQDPSGAIETV